MNTLYYGDNLDILRKHIKDESVDIIYLDPPFNSKADYNILYKEMTGESSKAQITAFEDTWHWTEETAKTFQEIVDTASGNVVSMMNAFRQFVGLNDVMAYLTMMCVRLIELRRVLKSTGLLYLHCDPTASHYLKIVLDTVFGKQNFRNEIVWGYSGGGTPRNDFPRKHDIIFRYSKSKNYHYQPIFKPYTQGTIQRGRTQVKGDIELNQEGTPVTDWWFSNLECDNCGSKLHTNIKRIVSPTDPEKLGYQTQKSEELLDRILSSSTTKESVVLDPFCGCGTTVAVSQKKGLNWIGIDITHLAINVIKARLSNEFHIKPKVDYRVIGEPEDLEGAKELAHQNRYQFQWWALSLIGARPYGDKKKGKDTGIDGFIYINESASEIKKIIVQVKSGHVKSGDIRDLGHVIDREKAEMGIFISLEPPTRDMIAESTTKGYYEFPFNRKKYQKIQIITIEELFEGKKPDLPPSSEIFKKAKTTGTSSQPELTLKF